MKKIIFLLVSMLYGSLLFAQFNANISEITPNIEARIINGDSWRLSCPVGLNNLRYLQLTYWDFNGQTKVGEMIVHQDVATEVVYIFEVLYNINYPIYKMELVSNYQSNDWQSIEADNTSAFNCRPATGSSKKWSNHAYGKAIDINPLENPYVARNGHISHNASLQYKRRVHKNLNNPADRAVVLKNDQVTRLFESYGWKWGGDWNTIKDYQHFEKK